MILPDECTCSRDSDNCLGRSAKLGVLDNVSNYRLSKWASQYMTIVFGYCQEFMGRISWHVFFIGLDYNYHMSKLELVRCRPTQTDCADGLCFDATRGPAERTAVLCLNF